MSNKKITIALYGGIVQSVEGIPPGYETDILDFDVEDLSEEEITVDKELDAEFYRYKSVWGCEGLIAGDNVD